MVLHAEALCVSRGPSGTGQNRWTEEQASRMAPDACESSLSGGGE